jgi:DNA-binding transcriptional ArsR family regulator
MVKYSRQLDTTFAALCDPTRRGIIERLARGEASVGELAKPYKVSLPAISRHLRVLERAGLIKQERQGRIRKCRLHAGPMHDASAWLLRYRSYWTSQLDALADFMEKPSK